MALNPDNPYGDAQITAQLAAEANCSWSLVRESLPLELRAAGGVASSRGRQIAERGWWSVATAGISRSRESARIRRTTRSA